MLVIKVYITALLSARVGAIYSYCDTHPWDSNCKFDDVVSLPADKVDHKVPGGYEIKTTGSPLPRMTSLAPIPRSSSNVIH